MPITSRKTEAILSLEVEVSPQIFLSQPIFNQLHALKRVAAEAHLFDACIRAVVRSAMEIISIVESAHHRAKPGILPGSVQDDWRDQMKLLKLLGATVVSVCAFAGPALAGQGFDVTFARSVGFPSTVIGNITYKQWYENQIVAGSSVDSWGKTVYTEHCAAWFGCGNKQQGNDSLAVDGIIWSLMDGSAAAVNFCISDRQPISTICGVHDSGGSQLTYKHWIAGCVAKSGYTCVVTSMQKSGSRISIIYALGVPSSIMKK